MVVVQQQTNQVQVDKTREALIQGLKGKSSPLPEQAALLLLSNSSNNLQNVAQGAQKGLKSSSNPSSIPESELAKDPLLRALCDKLELDETLFKNKQDLIDSLIGYFEAQVQSADQIKQKIQDLTNKLKKNLSPEQIKEIETKLSALESQYNKALNQYNSAASDKSSQKSDIEKLKEQNEKLKKEEASETDPKKKKELKKEIKANTEKVKSDRAAIEQDKTTMASAQEDISAAAAGFQKLESQYPSLSGSLKSLVTAIQSHQDISTAFNSLKAGLDKEAKEDSEYSAEISSLNTQMNSIIDNMNQHLAKMKTIMRTYDNGEVDEKYKITMNSLRDLVTDYIEEKLKSFFHRREEIKDLKETKKLNKSLLGVKKGIERA